MISWFGLLEASASGGKRIGKAVACIIVVLLITVSGLIGFKAGRTVYAGRRTRKPDVAEIS